MPTRAEHRRTTLLRLGDAAIELFEHRGIAVTIEEIAAKAGVSRRTVFRYVDGKEQLAFVHPMIWFDVFDKALSELASQEMLLSERLRLASRAIATHIDADPHPPRHAFLVAALNPDLIRGFNAIFQEWVDRIAAEVVAADPQPTAATIFRSRIIGSSMMGMVDAVSREWLLSPPETTFTELYDGGFDFMAPLFSQIDLPVGDAPAS